MNFDRFTARMEQIHMKASATREELALAEMLGKLVAAYDAPAMNRALSKTSPIDMVRHLMEQNLRQVDLLPVFGSRGAVSNALTGKRASHAISSHPLPLGSLSRRLDPMELLTPDEIVRLNAAAAFGTHCATLGQSRT